MSKIVVVTGVLTIADDGSFTLSGNVIGDPLILEPPPVVPIPDPKDEAPR